MEYGPGTVRLHLPPSNLTIPAQQIKDANLSRTGDSRQLDGTNVSACIVLCYHYLHSDV
jgi:hypothetical protein